MLNLRSLFQPQDDNDFLSNDYGLPNQNPRSILEQLMQPTTGPYNPMQNSGASIPQPRIDPTGMGDLNPTYHDIDRIRQLYDQMPTRDSMQPSKTRRVLGALVSLGSVSPATYDHGAALGFNNDPAQQAKIKDLFENKAYYNKMDEFNDRTKGAVNLANIELKSNEDKRRMQDSQDSEKLRRDELDRKAAWDATRDANIDAALAARIDASNKAHEVALFKAETGRKRAESYANNLEWKHEHPEWKSAVDDENGEIVFWNPITGETKRSGIDQATAEEKQRFKTEGSLKEIQARHQASLSEIGARGAAAQATKETPSGTVTNKTTKPLTPSQTRTDKANRVTAYKEAHPEWSQFISMDSKTGEITVKPAATHSWQTNNPDKNTYDTIRKDLGLSGKSSTVITTDTAHSEDAAKKYLQDHGKAITPATVDYLMKNKDKW